MASRLCIYVDDELIKLLSERKKADPSFSQSQYFVSLAKQDIYNSLVGLYIKFNEDIKIAQDTYCKIIETIKARDMFGLTIEKEFQNKYDKAVHVKRQEAIKLKIESESQMEQQKKDRCEAEILFKDTLIKLGDKITVEKLFEEYRALSQVEGVTQGIKVEYAYIMKIWWEENKKRFEKDVKLNYKSVTEDE